MPVETALIGLLGVLIGLLANEFFRRRNRIESYSSSIFNKRIEIYEELFQRVSDCSSIMTDVIENPAYSKEQRKEIVSTAIFDLASFGDKHDFYMNEHIVLHYMTLLMGVEDIYDIKNEKQKKKEIERVWKNLREIKRMIRKESGIEALDKLFRSITMARHKSPLIEYYSDLEKQQRKSDKKI
jgi:F0F1-type ATP synthase delta subunit